MARYHRTTIDVDVDAFSDASRALGTSGYKDTVNTALREASRMERLQEAADYVRAGKLSAPSAGQLREMRKPRRPR